MTQIITVHGGLTAEPELRFSQNGVAVLSGTVASTERYKKGDEWVDGKKLFLRFSAFKDIAENVAASSLEKGCPVVLTGKLHTKEWEDRDGGKRSSLELEVTDFAVSLKRATASVTRASAVNRGGNGATAEEPWGNTPAANPTASQGESNGFTFDETTPF